MHGVMDRSSTGKFDLFFMERLESFTSLNKYNNIYHVLYIDGYIKE